MWRTRHVDQVDIYCPDMKTARLFAAVAMITLGAIAVHAQAPAATPLPPDKQAKRDATRESLRKLLNNLPNGLQPSISFRQSEKQPYNFVGVFKSLKLKNAAGFEVVIGVSTDETIGFRIYPYFNGTYVNVDKARNGPALLRQMLNLNDHNFLFWGADDTLDVFAGYTFTLESGFPEESLRTVLWSIEPLDQYVGQMRPNIDGSSPVK